MIRNKSKSKLDLISNVIQENKETGKPLELLGKEDQKKRINFIDLDIDSIKPKKQLVEYASVKVKTELYERVRLVARYQGIKQPGKFISLILEAYLKQIGED